MSRRSVCARRSGLALLGVLGTVLALGWSAGTAAAASPPLWSGAQEVESPAAMSAGEDGASLTGVSCPGPHDCAAIGRASRDGHSQATVADGVTGNGGQAEFVRLPDETQVTESALESISCTAAGQCTAVGYETLESRVNRAIVVSEVDGVWGTATAIETPAASADASLTSVACTAPGDCTAVGFYEDATDTGDGESYEAVAVAEVDGRWGASTTVPQPPNAEAYGGLESVSCPAVGACAATGWYLNGEAEEYEAFGASEADGTWSSQEIRTPANEDGYEYTVLQVSCAVAGSCQASGYYYDRRIDNYRAISASLADGRWSGAVGIIESPLGPEDGDEYAYLGAPSCPISDFCAAGGAYLEFNGGQLLPMVAEAHDGRWGLAHPLSLPSNALTEQGAEELDLRREAAMEALSCTTPGDCVAVGFFTDVLGLKAPLVATETEGTWGDADGLFVPPVVTGDSQLSAVSCTAAGCGAVGEFGGAAGESRGLAASAVPALELTGAGLPSAAVGAPYEARLMASGGGGDYAWRVASGALPAGLSLDPATGVISGTPTTAENADFEIELAASGPPPQRLERALSIAVTEIEPLRVSTTALPAAAVGTAYEARLAAAGGAGDYSWSVASGALPQGLSLQPATGLISGTPTEAGEVPFTVAVEAAGPPGEAARRELSIAVSAREESGSHSHSDTGSGSTPTSGSGPDRPATPPPPGDGARPKPLIAIKSARLKVKGRAVKVKLACRRAACRGLVELTAVVAGDTGAGRAGVKRKRTLARGRYRIGRGKVKVVDLRLNRGATRPRPSPDGKVRASLTVSASGGRTVRRVVVLTGLKVRG